MWQNIGILQLKYFLLRYIFFQHNNLLYYEF